MLAFTSFRDGAGGVFVTSPLTGDARRVCSMPGNGPAAPWSPDGREVACQSVDNGVRWLVRTSVDDGTSRRHPLVEASRNQKLDMTWSPDGRLIAYVDARDNSAQITRIWVLRVEDDRAIPVTDGRLDEWSPSWSPDSRVLYFVSNRGGPKDLWQQRLSPDGAPDGPPARITTGLELRNAAVSPDGRRVAYSKGRNIANVWRFPILTDRLATWADAHQVTRDQAWTEQVALSADGTRMLVSSDRSGNPDLWSLPVAGGDMQQVTTDPMPDWAPAWSPDGRTAAFYSARTGNREIWLQPLAGGPARQLTTGQAQNVYPAWSPDGSRLAFERDGQICIVLVADGAERCLDRPQRGAYFPAWSPDGQWLAVQLGGGTALARVPAAGGPFEQLRERVGVTRPAWSAGRAVDLQRGPARGQQERLGGHRGRHGAATVHRPIRTKRHRGVDRFRDRRSILLSDPARRHGRHLDGRPRQPSLTALLGNGDQHARRVVSALLIPPGSDPFVPRLATGGGAGEPDRSETVAHLWHTLPVPCPPARRTGGLS